MTPRPTPLRSAHSSFVIPLLAFAALAPLHSHADSGLDVLVSTVGKMEQPAVQANLLRGMAASLKGRQGVPAPKGWTDLEPKLRASGNAEVRDIAAQLAAIFGSKDAFAAFRAALADDKTPTETRAKAIESLVAAKDEAAAPLLRELAQKPGPLRATAIRGLAAWPDKDIVHFLMALYTAATPEVKTAILDTLASRSDWAGNFGWLLDGNQLPKTDFTPSLVRLLRNHHIAGLDTALDRHFGKGGANSAERQKEIAAVKQWLTADFIAKGDPAKGRAVFDRACAACHRLFNGGGEIGPELTGANRTDADYLLQNIVDPNAMIGTDYQLHLISTKDGRTIAGTIKASDANTLTIRTPAETLILDRAQVAADTIQEVSMMPEGLLTALPKDDVRDLFRYLASPAQVAPAP